jgi:hypothetical protein
MSKFKKQIILSVGLTSLSSAIAQSIPINNGIYDMRPKNSFRGGAIGKGGKIKYQRR